MEYLACSKCGRPVEDEPYCGNCVSDYCARIAALEAQLREREEKLFHALTDLKSAQDGVERLMISSRAVDALNARAESAETALAAARAEIAKLKADHCSECGGDMFTRTDTGAQQCLECGTPFVPLRARPDDGRVERVERVAEVLHGGRPPGPMLVDMPEGYKEMLRDKARAVLESADGVKK